MSSVEYRFLEPLDVLFLRGNKLFGDPGSFGESLVPPWPSVAAGAIRSRMLAEEGVDLAAFARGAAEHPVLGTPETPGAFSIVAFHLARCHADGGVEVLIQPPADLVVTENDDCTPRANLLSPASLPQAGEGLSSSAAFARLPVLAERTRGKPAGGWWLTETGWKKYLDGEAPAADQLVDAKELWKLDHRVGVGLDAGSRRAADGRLFSVQAVAMKPGVGFVVAVTGAVPPRGGTVRLGGDGRAAAVHAVGKALPRADFDAIAKARCCRLVLATPGIFDVPRPHGGNGPGAAWLPTGTTPSNGGECRFDLHGVKGRVVCAAVPRFEVVSGWDLARGKPKPALRAAPAGSVYWLELDDGVSAGSLGKLAERGLWSEPCEDVRRRAEGFNRVYVTKWN